MKDLTLPWATVVLTSFFQAMELIDSVLAGIAYISAILYTSLKTFDWFEKRFFLKTTVEVVPVTKDSEDDESE